MTPPCYNREPYRGRWVDTGKARFNLFAGFDGTNRALHRPVYRYQWPWFVDRCTLHDVADIGPEQTYPQAHGWNCEGCRWLPTHLSTALQGNLGQLDFAADIEPYTLDLDWRGDKL